MTRNKRKLTLKRFNIREILTRELDLPKEAALDLPLISLVGANEVTVENYKNIVEFAENTIRLSARGCVIKIEGARLIIRNISSDSILINGTISKVEIIK